MKMVLFICVHNSGRSQMAEAFFNRYAKGKAMAISAGTQPASHVDRTVMEAMKEVGVDISANRSKLLTLEMMESVDKAVTMGCGVEDVCPATFIPSEDWHLEDPEGKPIEKVRRIRNEIDAKVKKLIREILGKRGENVAAAI
jgi:arsenate reductase